MHLGTLAPGVYVVTLHLVFSYIDGTECDIRTEPLEITVVSCPCNLDPYGRIYCMEPIPDDAQGPFLYHFEIFTGYQCSGNPIVSVTGQNGIVTLLPWNNPPGYITGMLSTPEVYPVHGCIELTFTDPLKPDCNCNFVWCEKLPKCPYSAKDCEFGITAGEIFCIGFDPSGNPVYQFQININTANPLHATWLSQGLTLSGFPVIIPPGQNVYTVTVTAPPTATGFCIRLRAYDFVTHKICLTRICFDQLPGCEVPTRPATAVVSGEANPAITVNTSLQIVPNPAKDEVAVYYTLPSAGTLMMMTPEGKTVSRHALTENAGQLILNLNNYQPGIYLISLKPADNSAIFRKFVIIR